MRVVPPETESPAKRKGGAKVRLSRAQVARALAVMTLASATGGILFNLTTNGNAQLLTERFRGVMNDPAMLGLLLASIYAIASLAQIVVGRLIDRVALKPLYLSIALLQVPVLLLLVAGAGLGALRRLLGMMIFIFGAIPFTDAMIVRYVDDHMRSRVAGMRLAVSLGISSLAVWLLGPLVKGMGFDTLLLILAGVALCTAFTVLWLPSEQPAAGDGGGVAGQPSRRSASDRVVSTASIPSAAALSVATLLRHCAARNCFRPVPPWAASRRSG